MAVVAVVVLLRRQSSIGRRSSDHDNDALLCLLKRNKSDLSGTGERNGDDGEGEKGVSQNGSKLEHFGN